MEASLKYDRLRRYIVSLESDLGRMKRVEQTRFEMEQRYMAIMESDVFLCALLTPDGRFNTMNLRAEKFFGFQPRLGRVTLQSIAGPGCVGEVEAALKDAQAAPVHFPLSIVRADGSLGWLDMEFFASLYHGEPAIQILAFEITDQVKRTPKEPEPDPDGRAPVPEEPLSGSEKNKLTAEILDAIPEMLFVIDDDARFVDANSRFLDRLGLQRDEIAGKPLPLLLKEDSMSEDLPESLVRAARGGKSADLECEFRARDGEILFLNMSASPLPGEDGLTLVGCTDNTKLRRTEEQLKRVSTTDASTGILNRQGLERFIGSETQRVARYRGSLAMILMDVDGFRGLNERIGYAASDRVLKELAAAVKSHIRPTDFWGRWGGDEFMILTPQPLASAFQFAEKIRDMIQHKNFVGNSSLTLSAGVVEYHKSMDMSAFTGMAYDSMMEAKRGGGNRTVQAKEAEGQAADIDSWTAGTSE